MFPSIGSKPHCRGTSPLKPSCAAPQKHFLFYGEPQPGDTVSVGLSSVGVADVMLSAQVSASFPDDPVKQSEVRVVLRNVGAEEVDLKNGTLRVVVTRWAD